MTNPSFTYMAVLCAEVSPLFAFNIAAWHMTVLFRHEYGSEVSPPSLYLHESVVAPYFQAATTLHAQ